MLGSPPSATSYNHRTALSGQILFSTAVTLDATEALDSHAIPTNTTGTAILRGQTPKLCPVISDPCMTWFATSVQRRSVVCNKFSTTSHKWTFTEQLLFHSIYKFNFIYCLLIVFLERKLRDLPTFLLVGNLCFIKESPFPTGTTTEKNGSLPVSERMTRKFVMYSKYFSIFILTLCFESVQLLIFALFLNKTIAGLWHMWG